MTQLEEIEKAAQENRQPSCVYCGKPLDVVYQFQPTHLYWVWNETAGCFTRSDEDSDAGKPYHDSDECLAENWDFLGDDKAHNKLGLTW